MDEIIVTQKQEDALKKLMENQIDKDRDRLLVEHAKYGGYEILMDVGVNLPLLAKMLYGRYEVKPEYKTGDWVRVIAHESPEYIGIVAKVTNTSALERYPIGLDFDGENQVFALDEIRHATPSEIAEERERRFFDGHGRSPWELRRGDILFDESHGDIIVVNEIKTQEDMTAVFYMDDYMYPSDVKEYYKVATFAKYRLDVKTNE